MLEKLSKNSWKSVLNEVNTQDQLSRIQTYNLLNIQYVDFLLMIL